jgi:hypothetical protein
MDDFFNKTKTPFEAQDTTDSGALPYFAYSHSTPDRLYDNFEKKDDISTYIGTMGIDMVKPNSQLTDHHINGAKMAYVAKKYYTEGLEQARIYIAHEQLNVDIVDWSRYGVMLRDRETGSLTLALRGIEKTSLRDYQNVARQPFGTNESIEMANEMLNRAEAPVERIVGYSMGAVDGLDIARARGIDATLYDPTINPRQVLSNSSAFRAPQSDIEIVRNAENTLSIGTSFRNVSVAPQYRVSVVPVGQSGVFASHELLPNFTDTQLRSAQQSALSAFEEGEKMFQTATLIKMKEAMNLGETFTDFVNSFAALEDTTFLNEMWRQFGGTFTIDEITTQMKDLSITQVPDETRDLVSMMEDLSLEPTQNPQDRSQTLLTDDDVVQLIKDNNLTQAQEKMSQRFSASTQAVNENEVLSHPAVQRSVAEHIESATHPTTMITGVLAGVVGGAIMNKIDPSGSFGQNNETGVVEFSGVSGSLSGVLGDVMLRGASGEGALVGGATAGVAVSAGVASVAGEATRYEVEKGLKEVGAKQNTRESLSDIAGGAVGGATFALAGDALAIGAAAATGAEIGALGGPAGVAIGAGVGAVLGAAAYGVSKLNQVPIVHKYENQVGKAITKEARNEVNRVKTVFHTIGGWFN